MQYLTMTKDMTLSQLSATVGERNVDYVLNANSLKRTVNIGKSFYSREVADVAIDETQQLNILNRFVGYSDLFEKAALGSVKDWQSLAQYNCFTDAIRLPEDIKLPSSVGVLGNPEPISDRIYQACVTSLIEERWINPLIFAEYNATFASSGVTTTGFDYSGGKIFDWAALPWGKICLYSTLGGPDEMLYFPVYPEELSDGYSANFEDMSEMLYQYEPWKVYKSSGPREMTFTFEFHRDMWTGDHRDGNANNLVRGCEANCFPDFNGSLVNAPVVTLYINGNNYITGVMTSCKVNWKGPIGLDGFYLICNLSFTIVEVSPEPLNYTSVRNKGLLS